jgi:PAS domain S-box-containing protein
MTDTQPDGVGTLRVLHVDDDERVRDLVRTLLVRERPTLDVVSVDSVQAGLDRLPGTDCVVSDYQMPGDDGLAFLRAVRERDPKLPFVLYTAAGSEEVAAEAISAGVTDYLQKSTAPEQYALLATRVHGFATQYRTARAIARQGRRFRKLVEHSSDVVSIVDASGVFQYLSPASRHVFGYDPDDLVGEVGFDYLHPDDVEYAAEELARAIGDPSSRPVITFRFAHPERGWIVLENTGRNLLDDPDIGGFLINSHDVTERVDRAAELERQRDRLGEFAGVVSHDLRNPLSVATGNLSLLETTGDVSHAAVVGDALERMEAIIDDLLRLAREGDELATLAPVSLRTVAGAAWRSVDSRDATLTVDTTAVVAADRGRLQQLLENLFSNAVAHAGPTTHVRVVDVWGDRERDGRPDAVDGVAAADGAGGGGVEPNGGADGDGTTEADGEVPSGFAVVDDGPGIAQGDRERIFEYGVSSSADRTGFGLAIVRRVAEAHGWTPVATTDPDGGARFEFRGVRLADEREAGEGRETGGGDDVPTAG